MFQGQLHYGLPSLRRRKPTSILTPYVSLGYEDLYSICSVRSFQYEDPTKAVKDFARELDPNLIVIESVIGGGMLRVMKSKWITSPVTSVLSCLISFPSFAHRGWPAEREEERTASSINQQEMLLFGENLRKIVSLMRKDGCRETIITS